MFRLRNQKGFTLIELLIVIAIIGILATLLILALQGARVRAAQSKTKDNIIEVTKALELHRNESTDDLYPSNMTGTNGAKDVPGSEGKNILQPNTEFNNQRGIGSGYDLIAYCRQNMTKDHYMVKGQYKNADDAWFWYISGRPSGTGGNSDGSHFETGKTLPAGWPNCTST